VKTAHRGLDWIRGDAASHVLVLQLALTGMLVASAFAGGSRGVLFLITVIGMGLLLAYRSFSPTARRHDIDHD
jgi:hypothetical protein